MLSDRIFAVKEFAGKAFIDYRYAARGSRVLVADETTAKKWYIKSLKVMRTDAQPGRHLRLGCIGSRVFKRDAGICTATVLRGVVGQAHVKHTGDLAEAVLKLLI